MTERVQGSSVLKGLHCQWEISTFVDQLQGLSRFVQDLVNFSQLHLRVVVGWICIVHYGSVSAEYQDIEFQYTVFIHLCCFS